MKAHGKQLRAWNDIYEVVGGTQAPNPDIVLEMWWPYLSPQEAFCEGARHHQLRAAGLRREATAKPIRADASGSVVDGSGTPLPETNVA